MAGGVKPSHGGSDETRIARLGSSRADPLDLPAVQAEAVEGCPRDCGICPEHKQHTCLGIIEVNTGCNLDCPICFADSGTGHQPDGFSLMLEQVERMLDAFV